MMKFNYRKAILADCKSLTGLSDQLGYPTTEEKIKRKIKNYFTETG